MSKKPIDYRPKKLNISQKLYRLSAIKIKKCSILQVSRWRYYRRILRGKSTSAKNLEKARYHRNVLRKKKNDFRGRGGTGYHTHAHIHTHTPSDPGSHRLLNASAYHLKLVKCAAGVRLSSHPAKKSYFFLKMCLHINFDFFAQKSSVFLNQKFPNSSFSLKLHL